MDCECKGRKINGNEDLETYTYKIEVKSIRDQYSQTVKHSQTR